MKLDAGACRARGIKNKNYAWFGVFMLRWTTCEKSKDSLMRWKPKVDGPNPSESI